MASMFKTHNKPRQDVVDAMAVLRYKASLGTPTVVRVTMPQSRAVAVDFIDRPFGIAVQVDGEWMFATGGIKFTQRPHNAVRFWSEEGAHGYLATLPCSKTAIIVKFKIPFVRMDDPFSSYNVQRVEK